MAIPGRCVVTIAPNPRIVEQLAQVGAELSAAYVRAVKVATVLLAELAADERRERERRETTGGSDDDRP